MPTPPFWKLSPGLRSATSTRFMWELMGEVQELLRYAWQNRQSPDVAHEWHR